MKLTIRLFSMFLVVLSSISMRLNATAVPVVQNPDIETIVIETQNDTGRERGGSLLVEAYYDHSTNTIYISLASSVGSTSITITNADNELVHYSVVDATLQGFAQIIAPIVPGTYTIAIQSTNYYGAGTFTV